MEIKDHLRLKRSEIVNETVSKMKNEYVDIKNTL